MFQTDPDREKKEIIKRYRNILQALPSDATLKDKRLIRKAFNLAQDAHKNTRRKNGDPYLYHPLEVAQIVVAEIGLGSTAVVCALLHDVVEDSDYTLDYIELHFGERVKNIIDGLTKIEEIPEVETPSMQAENFRKVLVSLSADVRVILVKLADRLHNMRTLDSMAPEKQMKIASETLFLYAPLALRLGLYQIKSELEDLSIKYTEPGVYETINQKLNETKSGRERFIHEFVMPIKESLGRQGIKYEISGREKSVHSIWSKMQEKEIPFEEVFDVFAIRIIIDSDPEEEKVDCWRVYSIVTDHYRPQQNRLRDWISTPKANGYESLHTTVMSQTGQWVEVQIRTRRMNEVAERGYAAHWKYKEKDNGNSARLTTLDRYLLRIRDLLQSPDPNALAFLEDFKLNLFTDEIFVFTPKGELRTLPFHSSALDFAYAIHSEIGNTCIAAKVNHKLVPLHHKLRSGDQVEIINSKKQKPRDEWLDWVVTARARMQIKDAVREEKKLYSAEGKEKLVSYFKALDVEFTKHNLNKFMDYSGIASNIDLYYMVAKGDITQKDVKDCCQDQQKAGWFSFVRFPFSKSKSNESKPLGKMIAEKVKSTPEALLLGGDFTSVNYTISKCCNPIPGDDVMGFITQQGSISIHRTNCQEAVQLSSKYGNRIVKTKWKSREAIAFLAGLKISGIDRAGLLLDIVNLVSDKHKVNIKSFVLDSSGDFWQASIMLYVHDTIKLRAVMDDLKKIKDVKTVTRIDRLTENQA
ncbi:MAG: bifunctional (p)ppGpp synthetase/guanosine-3',5'-bis(diphosphate) 3'-pyrophosphohydrolase [Bacteroidales bacterium]|nr:bifunctional (p)ppGpp synthetase/guanosine-3',5'-bis(diphosphate) 3'-pyrophosphohydrolase [Bacteroidales bacterium]